MCDFSGEISAIQVSIDCSPWSPSCPVLLTCLYISGGNSSLAGPLNRLKASGVGVHIPVGPAGKAAAFQEKRLFEWAIYRASTVPADEWDIQANKGGRVIT